MLKHEVGAGITRGWKVVLALNLGETISSPVALPVNEEFRDLALSERTSYVDIYMAGLRLSHYNFLLTDHSFFQFSWAPDGVRYAYCPNPFVPKAGIDEVTDPKFLAEMVEEEAITHEEYLSFLRDASVELRTPPVRYENAPSQYRGLAHPCSHFHIGHHSDNRWPLSRTLTPLAFTLLILKYYHGLAWHQVGLDEKEASGNRFDTELIKEKLNCRIIVDELFSDVEKTSFFFA